MNDVPEWMVANQDGKPLPELRGKEWDQITDFKYYVAGREVRRDVFEAVREAWWMKYAPDWWVKDAVDEIEQ